MKEYLKIIDEIIALVGLHLIPKFVNLYQGQVDIRCEENDTGVLINIIVSLPDKNELQALQNQVGMDSLQAKQDLRRNIKIGENGFMQTIGKQTTGIETNLA